MFFLHFPNGLPPLTGAQLKAARALLGITAEELAKRSRVGVATIRRAEGQETATVTDAILMAVLTALDASGVQIIPADETAGAGVRLKEPHSTRPPALKEG